MRMEFQMGDPAQEFIDLMALAIEQCQARDENRDVSGVPGDDQRCATQLPARDGRQTELTSGGATRSRVNFRLL